MDSEKIIDALGGPAKLAKKFGIPKPTVQAWKKRGIPPKWILAHMALFKRGERKATDKERALANNP